MRDSVTARVNAAQREAWTCRALQPCSPWCTGCTQDGVHGGAGRRCIVGRNPSSDPDSRFLGVFYLVFCHFSTRNATTSSLLLGIREESGPEHHVKRLGNEQNRHFVTFSSFRQERPGIVTFVTFWHSGLRIVVRDGIKEKSSTRARAGGELTPEESGPGRLFLTKVTESD